MYNREEHSVTAQTTVQSAVQEGRRSRVRSSQVKFSLKTRRKLEHIWRESVVYGLAVLAFTPVMYFVVSETVRDLLP